MFRLCWLAAYAGSVLLANVFLDHFLPLPGFGLLSLGSVFFAAVFTLRDQLHRYGLPTVFLGIGLAVAVNAVCGMVLGLNPRLLMASFASIMVGELADTAIFQRMRSYRWHTRVLASNAVSVPLDSLAFTMLAFAGALSTFTLAQIIFADILGKYVIAVIIAWLPVFTLRESAGAAIRDGRAATVKTVCDRY